MATPKLFLRSANNYDTNEASLESSLVCTEPTLAQQSFAEEVDINTIVRRFGVTGELPQGIRMPTYGDFEGVFDFTTAMNAIALAGEAFDALPAEIRARFNNNPANFVDFCSDEANRLEAEKMGLIPPTASLSGIPDSSVSAGAGTGQAENEGDKP